MLTARGMSERQRSKIRERIGPLNNIRREPEGWSVVLMRKGVRHTDYFGDAVYGGRSLALLAAQRYRDILLRRIDPDTRVRRWMPRGVTSETGVVGVAFELYAVEGRWYERYVATWQDADGRNRRRRFSVLMRGKAKAMALAKKTRENGVAKAEAERRARQGSEATKRLARMPPMPRPVKDPLSRKGINTAPRTGHK
jgi:hypothetical protein